jgi:hypothetical protein
MQFIIFQNLIYDLQREFLILCQMNNTEKLVTILMFSSKEFQLRC